MNSYEDFLFNTEESTNEPFDENSTAQQLISILNVTAL